MQIERISRLEELYTHITNDTFEKGVISEKKDVNQNMLSVYGYGRWNLQPQAMERLLRWLSPFEDKCTTYTTGDTLYWDFQHMSLVSENPENSENSDTIVDSCIKAVKDMSRKGITIHARGLFIENNCIYMCGYPTNDSMYTSVCCAYLYLHTYCKGQNMQVKYTDSKYPCIRIPFAKFRENIDEKTLRVLQHTIERWKECYFGSFQPYIWIVKGGGKEKRVCIPAIIAHRGLLEGPDNTLENRIDKIAQHCFNSITSEIDIWYKDGVYKIGHDSPGAEIPLDFLYNYRHLLLIHTKNVDTFAHFHDLRYHKGIDFHYFYHTEENVVYTSRGCVIPYPGVTVHNGWMDMMPERKKGAGGEPAMYCSDFIGWGTLEEC